MKLTSLLSLLSFAIFFFFSFCAASSVAGLSGYYPTVTLAILAYVADTSQPNSRALRLGILEAIAFICGTVVYFSSGVWIKNYGYESVYLVILTLHLLNLIYVVIFLPESLPPELKQHNSVCSCESIKPIVLVYIKKRDGRWILFSLLVCAVIVYLASFVVQTLLVLYGKKSPLCWEESIIGYFLGTLLFSKAVGAVVGISLCSRLGISNYGAIQLGVFFLMANLVMIGFSRNTLEMFLGKTKLLYDFFLSSLGVISQCLNPDLQLKIWFINPFELNPHRGELFLLVSSDYAFHLANLGLVPYGMCSFRV